MQNAIAKTPLWLNHPNCWFCPSKRISWSYPVKAQEVRFTLNKGDLSSRRLVPTSDSFSCPYSHHCWDSIHIFSNSPDQSANVVYILENLHSAGWTIIVDPEAPPGHPWAINGHHIWLLPPCWGYHFVGWCLSQTSNPWWNSSVIFATELTTEV